MIRYHSFYPWHTGGAYQKLLCSDDERKLAAIKDFNRYDLYTVKFGWIVWLCLSC
jgi:inositol oxygenase